MLGDVPATFAAVLFARTAPEDLLVYDAKELATLARDAWGFLAVRKPCEPKVRFISPSASEQHKMPNPCTKCHTDKTVEWANDRPCGYT